MSPGNHERLRPKHRSDSLPRQRLSSTKRSTQQPPASPLADGLGSSNVGSAADAPLLVAVGELIVRQNGIARLADAEHICAMTKTLTAVLIREDEGFVALCPELDVASQGDSVEEAKANLREAVELFFECASREEVRDRLSSESYVSSLEVSVA